MFLRSDCGFALPMVMLLAGSDLEKFIVLILMILKLTEFASFVILLSYQCFEYCYSVVQGDLKL